MDLGVLLESPQWSQASSRVWECTCAFLPSCSSSVALPFAWIKGSVTFPRCFPTRLSHEALPRGFPTGLTHVSPLCESILSLNSRQCRENRFPWNGLRHLGSLVMVARPWSSSSLSCGKCLLLKCDGSPGNSFPTTQVKDPSYRARRRIGTPMDVGGTLVLPLEWRRVWRGPS